MNLAPQTIKKISEHATAAYPEEICGFIIDGDYFPTNNTADDKTTSFRISPEDRLNAEEIGKIEAVIHSHPYDKFNAPQYPAQWPSNNDMAGWINDNVPWGIVATDGEGITQPIWLDDNDIQPLEGREFISGVADCYTLIRDWYRLERGITLKNYPREMEWQNNGLDHYENRFTDAGFRMINRDEIQVGDLVFMKIHSPVICHAAVVTGNNEILHHLIHRLSGYDRLDRWDRQIVKAVRYTGSS